MRWHGDLLPARHGLMPRMRAILFEVRVLRTVPCSCKGRRLTPRGG
jgi:hypothetical protein